jgi:hypothetical protein
MESELLEIIKSHPNLNDKEIIMEDVKSMFEQIRKIRLENRGLKQKYNQVCEILLKD